MSKVVLIDSEYSRLVSGLSNIHTDCLQEMSVVKGQIESLNSKSGGFEAIQLTPKIKALVAELSNIQSEMETAFADNEAEIARFARMIDNYDSPC